MARKAPNPPPLRNPVREGAMDRGDTTIPSQPRRPPPPPGPPDGKNRA